MAHKDRRDAGSPLKPVQKVDIEVRHPLLRLVGVIVLLLIGATALVYAFMTFLGGKDGWQTVEATSSSYSSASECSFQYYAGTGKGSARAELRSVTAYYTEIAQKIFEIFHAQMEFDDVNNVYTLNTHPNEEIEVDDLLYQALETMEADGRRLLYLGPVYEEYTSLFSSDSDWEAQEFDPYTNADVAAYVDEVLAYAMDPEQIQLQLLGDDKVMLYVSDAYQEFAKENEIVTYLDFFWMENAFVVDDIADYMEENGYVNGILTSYDGFVRTLSGTGLDYSLPIADLDGQTIYPAATMHYGGGMALVCLRSYPQATLDELHYYTMEDGTIRNAYIDSADGLCKAATGNLYAYSAEASCVDIMFGLIPAYVTDSLDEDSLAVLDMLAQQGIYSIYCQDRMVY